MKSLIKNSLWFALASILLFACDKSDEIAPDAANIAFKLNGQSFNAGQKGYYGFTEFLNETPLAEIEVPTNGGYIGMHFLNNDTEQLIFGLHDVTASGDTLFFYFLVGAINNSLNDNINIPVVGFFEDAGTNVQSLIDINYKALKGDNWTTTEETGTIVLEKFDRNNMTISGTFSATLTGKKDGADNLTELKITEGKFSNLKLESPAR